MPWSHHKMSVRIHTNLSPCRSKSPTIWLASMAPPILPTTREYLGSFSVAFCSRKAFSSSLTTWYSLRFRREQLGETGPDAKGVNWDSKVVSNKPEVDERAVGARSGLGHAGGYTKGFTGEPLSELSTCSFSSGVLCIDRLIPLRQYIHIERRKFFEQLVSVW